MGTCRLYWAVASYSLLFLGCVNFLIPELHDLFKHNTSVSWKYVAAQLHLIEAYQLLCLSSCLRFDLVILLESRVSLYELYLVNFFLNLSLFPVIP